MKQKSLILIVILMALLIGCVTIGRKLEQANIEKIRKGETTREEVIKFLGSPDQMMRDANGNITMSYMYVRATAKPETFIPIVGAFIGGANFQNQTVIIVIDLDGIVKDIISSQGATESFQGLSIGSKPELPEVKKDKRSK